LTNKSLIIGVDVGGTFTDLAVIDEATGKIDHLKGLSTPADPADGTLALIRSSGLPVHQVRLVVHGTTVVINTLLERTGARTGLITTRGFRDVLEIRHGARTAICTPFLENPKPFIPRDLRLEGDEAVWASGEIEHPLDGREVERLLRELDKAGVTSVAVCFINSYANPAHEQLVERLAGASVPQMTCSISSDLASRIGEYERFATVMINAYVRPKTGRYIESMEKQLAEIGVPGGFYVMQSNGGIVGGSEAARRPVTIVESGPTGGVIASLALGESVGLGNLITFDMGGTTSKSGIILDGEAKVVSEFELLGKAGRPGSGWPLVQPMMDIPEIGVGGGSIGWLDAEGFLHVGPQSAGADPGPICYGRGGADPTLTDANVALGVVETLLDGVMRLEVEAARRGIRERLGAPLGLDAQEAGGAVRDIAIARSADLLREVTVARGLDPRDFTLVAYGGAGPMHACDLIQDLGMPRLIVPPSPGTFSAMGLVYADLRSDYVTTHTKPVVELAASEVDGVFRQLVQRAGDGLGRQGFRGDVLMKRSIDLRYVGQVHEVNVPIGDGAMKEGLAEVARAFHDAHQRLYAHAFPDEPVEAVNFRLSAIGLRSKPPLPKVAAQFATPPSARRTIFFRGSGTVAATVVQRRHLGAGFEAAGPMVIEEYSATTLVPPRFAVRVDAYGNLWLQPGG
jgi:N-methylhydantoinase A